MLPGLPAVKVMKSPDFVLPDEEGLFSRGLNIETLLNLRFGKAPFSPDLDCVDVLPTLYLCNRTMSGHCYSCPSRRCCSGETLTRGARCSSWVASSSASASLRKHCCTPGIAGIPRR